jgi:serine/threonine protein kinase
MEIKNVSNKIIDNRYKIINILGQGSTGITYATLDLATQSKVAVKAVSLQQLKDWKQLELLEREAKVLAQLDHPAIPKYLDYFYVDSEDERIFYIVQQLAPGKSLYQLIESGWRSTETEIKKTATQILDILSYVHSLAPPIIHRDIKPHNLILSDDGKIFLVDFGAVQNTYYNTLMKGSTVVGTYGYMAPEQFKGKATPATDLYGLGATVLYLLTHRSPNELPQNALTIDFRSSVNISEGLAIWLEKILQPDLESRFSSASEALESLNNRYFFKHSLSNKSKVALNLGLVGAIALGGIFGFNNYKWGILSRLGYQPSELCEDYEVIKHYLDTGGNPNINLLKSENILDCVINDNASASPDEIQEGVNLLIAKGAKLNLLSAAFIDSKDLVELLIANGADINAKNKNGSTALLLAVKNQNYEIVELLIAKGADINARDNDNKRPLMEVDNLAIAKLLVSKGADINTRDNYGNTPLMTVDNSEILKLLINHGADVNFKNKEGRTPLMSVNISKIAELLIEHGADVNAKDNYGNTPLITAKDPGIVKLLIDNGADVNARNNSSRNSLMNKNDPKTVKLLIDKGVDVNIVDDDGDTALLEATKPEIVKLLIDSGAEVNVKNNDGDTPLFRGLNNLEIAKLLITKGADVNSVDSWGNTPIFTMINVETTKLLIDSGADIEARNIYGNTPLLNAIDSREDAIVELLIIKGANVNIRNKENETPLSVTHKRFQYSGSGQASAQKVKEFLIQHGAVE